MKFKNTTQGLAIFVCIFLLACTAARRYKTTITTNSGYYQKGYDDTTLSEPKEMVLPTLRQGVHWLLSPQELDQLHHIIESADSESKALSLLQLFQ